MKYKKSFTLLETIVAIYVITVGLSAAMSLASFSLGAADVFKQQLIATNLAQEGVELVHNKRDSNYLTRINNCIFPTCSPSTTDLNDTNGNGILNGNECGSANGCQVAWSGAGDVQADNITFNECSSPPCAKLKRIKDGVAGAGLYLYNSGPNYINTNFMRTIFVNSETQSPGFRVRSQVNWTDKFGSKVVVVESYLTDHHK